jgi:tetratricopeptide (TPR) repeat protein
MTNYAADTKLSELTLADGPSVSGNAPSSHAPVAAAPAAFAPTLVLPTITAPALAPSPDAQPAQSAPSPQVANIGQPVQAQNGDRSLAQALKEFEAGQIDRPLWARAMAQSGGDKASAKATYLRARAIAMRIAKRDQRAGRSVRNVNTLYGADDASLRHAGSGKNMKRLTLAAGAIGSLVVIAGIAFMRWETAPAQQTPVATAAPRASTSGQPMPAKSAKQTGMSSASVERQEMSGDDFVGKVQALKDAGNWNVLVLYAVEWTRKQPGNPQAWKELGIGYATLRQFDDALEAATKAAQLAPEDFELWQTLGQINVALAQPAKALVAFERAADLNGRDVTSLVQAGTLNAELGHLPEARDAFAKALGVSPRDVDALCGAASIAQKEGHPKDAEAFLRQVKSLERVCRDTNAGESVSVTNGSGAKKKSVSPGAH